VGSGVAAALGGSVQPAAVKTRTAKSLRRESRARSSALALAFLFVAATFLIGMVVALLLSLAGCTAPG
jgi:F0F1-type ATP synthase membrane subunit c/vacuolar-type H+-ATPase subunit K